VHDTIGIAKEVIMEDSSEKLSSKAKSILSDHGYSKTCYPLDDLAKTIEDNKTNVARKILVYKWPGLALLVLIPVISTLLSVLISENISATVTGTMAVKIFSYSLTFLTLLNSIFKPGERFRLACSIGIEIQCLMDRLLTEVENLSQPVQDAKLLELCAKFRDDFVPIQNKLTGIFFPETAVQETGRPPKGRA
jgi:hypothetical protein